MSIEQWSEAIVIAELNDEPLFSEDMDALTRQIDEIQEELPDVVINLQAVSYLNSTNIAQLLRVRKRLVDNQARLRLCSVGDQVWSVMIVTGLDKLFDFTEDVATSLASLHIDDAEDDVAPGPGAAEGAAG
jgi:anti-anti-sigma factor